jgi:nicotinamidase-related amidase
MKALILIDHIHEMVHTDGKLYTQYRECLDTYHTLAHVRECVGYARGHNIEVIWVHLGFSPDYSNCSVVSPRFSRAPEMGIFRKDTWSTQFHTDTGYIESEKTIDKTRISAFYDTDLYQYLQSRNIDTVYIAGVATDLAVSSCVRDSHDRDMRVYVIADASATSSISDHQAALIGIAKIANVISTQDFCM